MNKIKTGRWPDTKTLGVSGIKEIKMIYSKKLMEKTIRLTLFQKWFVKCFSQQTKFIAALIKNVSIVSYVK